MTALSLSFEVAGVGIAADLLDGAGPEEINAALQSMLLVVRSPRFRALAAIARELASGEVLDPAAPVAPAPVALSVGASPAAVGASPVVSAPVDDLPDGFAFDNGSDVAGEPGESAGREPRVEVHDMTSTEVKAGGALKVRSGHRAYEQYGLLVPPALRDAWLAVVGLPHDVAVGVHRHAPAGVRVQMGGKLRFLEVVGARV